MRKACTAIVILLFSTLSFSAIRPEALVGKVRHQKTPFSTEKLGTAWCLTSDCGLMVTNYHVVRYLGQKLAVNGDMVSTLWIATGPDDVGARLMPSFTEAYKFNVVRDLAILRMKKPLASKGMHGVSLYSGELHSGEPVTILSYPAGKLTVTTGHFDALVEDGILKFGLDTPLTAGCSGGLILNSSDQAVGVLFALAPSLTSAFAVPMWSLAEFVKKVDADDYHRLFPVEPFRPNINGRLLLPADTAVPEAIARQIPEEAEDANRLFAAATGGLNPSAVLPDSMLDAAEVSAPAVVPSTSRELHPRVPESVEVQALRATAHRMVQQMADFIALQTVTFPGNAVWQHQVRVIDGQQLFVASDGTELKELPIPRAGMVPGSEWRDLPQMVGSDLRLPLRYIGEVPQGAAKVRVFEYSATAEDAVCGMRVKRGIFSRTWKGAVPCRGEVWTDHDFNILRITQDLAMPRQSGLTSSSISVLYGWAGFGSVQRRLVPVSMRLRAQDSKRTLIESSATFTNYRMFLAETTIRAN